MEKNCFMKNVNKMTGKACAIFLTAGLMLGCVACSNEQPVVSNEADSETDHMLDGSGESKADLTPAIKEDYEDPSVTETSENTSESDASQAVEEETPVANTDIVKADPSIPGSDANDPNGIHTYKIVIDDVTWTGAYEGAKEFEGGYLVHINSKEEYDHIIDFINKSGYDNKIFWVGARRNDEPAIYRWVDRENNLVGDNLLESEFWFDGEPTYYDSETATFETCVEMFYSKSKDKWVLNDVQEDVLELLPGYTGKMGYIVEIDK